MYACVYMYLCVCAHVCVCVCVCAWVSVCEHSRTRACIDLSIYLLHCILFVTTDKRYQRALTRNGYVNSDENYSRKRAGRNTVPIDLIYTPVLLYRIHN